MWNSSDAEVNRYTDFWRNLIFFSKGATGVEPVTYRTAADFSTTNLYTHVSLVKAVTYWIVIDCSMIER